MSQPSRQGNPPLNDCIARLAVSLKANGVPSEFTTAAANGIVYGLLRYGWERLSDQIPSSETMRSLFDLPLPAKLLRALVIESGLAYNLGGVLILCHALEEVPHYVQQRWRRSSPKSYQRAVERYKQRTGWTRGRQKGEYAVARPPPEEDEQYQAQDETETIPIDPESYRVDLFGDPIDERPRQKHRQTIARADSAYPGHKDIVEYWCNQWKRRYNCEYPFTKKDAGHIGKLLRTLGSVQRIRNVIDTYLAQRDKFFVGHPLGKLVTQLSIFVANAEAPTELPYEGGATEGRLPLL